MVFQKVHGAETLVVALEGNIGAGKSTLLEALRSRGVSVLQEPVDSWTKPVCDGESVMSAYYADPARHAATFQQYILLTRLRQLKEAVQAPERPAVLVMERSLATDHAVFTRSLVESGAISGLDADVYGEWHREVLRWADDLLGSSARPGLVVHLDTPPEKCLERVRTRGRPEENGVTLDFLRQLDRLHAEWLASCGTRVVRLTDGTPDQLADALVREVRETRGRTTENLTETVPGGQETSTKAP